MITRRRALGASLAPLAASLVGPRAVIAADEVYTLRLSTGSPAGGTYFLHATEFAQAVDRRTNGRVKVEIYPSGQLAKLTESIQGLLDGTVDLALIDSSFLTAVFPPAQVLIMPFLFKDVASLYRVVDGPIGNELLGQLSTKGILGLSWGAGSFRTMDTTGKAITKVDDMKGLRFRIHGGADVQMMQALGAIPVTIDGSEMHTSLSQHAIDGVEISVESLTAEKLYTLIKHIAFTNHVVSLAPLLASRKKIDSLPPDLQRTVKEQAIAVRQSWRALSVRRSQEAVNLCKSNGVTFTDVEYAPFRAAMEPVYGLFEQKLGADLVQRVSRAALATR